MKHAVQVFSPPFFASRALFLRWFKRFDVITGKEALFLYQRFDSVQSIPQHRHFADQRHDNRQEFVCCRILKILWSLALRGPRKFDLVVIFDWAHRFHRFGLPLNVLRLSQQRDTFGRGGLGWRVGIFVIVDFEEQATAL